MMKEKFDNERLNSIAEKIQKLFALAESSNPEEAGLAAEKARQLLEKYNMSLTDVEIKTAEMVEAGVGVDKCYGRIRRGYDRKYKNIPAWSYGLIGLMKEYFYIETLLAGSRYSKDNMYFLGAKKDVDVATYVFQYLFRETERLCDLYMKQYRGQHLGQHEAKALSYSYKMGVVSGIEEVLRKQCAQRNKSEARTKNGTELVPLKQEVAERFKDNLHPHLVSKRIVYREVSSDAMGAGRKDGKQVQIHRGVNKTSSQRAIE